MFLPSADYSRAYDVVSDIVIGTIYALFYHTPVILHAPGGPAGYLLPIQALYNVQAHIDARRDACRGDNMALVNHACIGLHLDLWIVCAHPFDAVPVRGGPALIEQTQ